MNVIFSGTVLIIIEWLFLKGMIVVLYLVKPNKNIKPTSKNYFTTKVMTNAALCKVRRPTRLLYTEMLFWTVQRWIFLVVRRFINWNKSSFIELKRTVCVFIVKSDYTFRGYILLSTACKQVIFSELYRVVVLQWTFENFAVTSPGIRRSSKIVEKLSVQRDDLFLLGESEPQP